jgi:hypothetical protein
MTIAARLSSDDLPSLGHQPLRVDQESPEQGGAQHYEFYLFRLSCRGEAAPSRGMAVMDFASIWS